MNSKDQRILNTMVQFLKIWIPFFLFALYIISCRQNNSAPSKALISQLPLKRGKIISCGLTDNGFGTLDLQISGGKKTKSDFNMGLELLHSFEYDEAEKVFAKIIDETPSCAMAPKH